MPDPRQPGVQSPEYEEIEFIRPDGTMEILEFEVGTPEPVMMDALKAYSAQLSGQGAASPGPEVGPAEEAQGALTDLDRAVAGGAPPPAPFLDTAEKIITAPSTGLQMGIAAIEEKLVKKNLGNSERKLGSARYSRPGRRLRRTRVCQLNRATAPAAAFSRQILQVFRPLAVYHMGRNCAVPRSA